MLGPGTSVSHAAVKAVAENGCSIVWVGEHGVRCYAQGLGETRSAKNIIKQARLCSDKDLRLQVVMRLYRMRFQEALPEDCTLQQIRGHEGLRVRTAYARLAEETGVKWSGRNYDRRSWRAADPANRALSAANACLYGVCHAAIVSLGYSPALGFIHTGRQLSFVYDVSDLYKVDITLPVAFRAASQQGDRPGLERAVRLECRSEFERQRLLARVVSDIEEALAIDSIDQYDGDDNVDSDYGLPGGFWDPDQGTVPGGVNYDTTQDRGAESDGADDTRESSDLPARRTDPMAD
jgi:CRISPR-associated protein Cas1